MGMHTCLHARLHVRNVHSKLKRIANNKQMMLRLSHRPIQTDYADNYGIRGPLWTMSAHLNSRRSKRGCQIDARTTTSKIHRIPERFLPHSCWGVCMSKMECVLANDFTGTCFACICRTSITAARCVGGHIVIIPFARLECSWRNGDGHLAIIRASLGPAT